MGQRPLVAQLRVSFPSEPAPQRHTPTRRPSRGRSPPVRCCGGSLARSSWSERAPGLPCPKGGGERGGSGSTGPRRNPRKSTGGRGKTRDRGLSRGAADAAQPVRYLVHLVRVPHQLMESIPVKVPGTSTYRSSPRIIWIPYDTWYR